MGAVRIRRWLVAIGGVLLVALAVLHTLGGGGDPADETGRRLVADMRAYKIDPSLNASMMDATDTLSHTMAITFAAIGLIALLIAFLRDSTDKLRRLFALINVLWIAAFAALSFAHHLTPPALFTAPAGVLFLVAALWPRPTQAPS